MEFGDYRIEIVPDTEFRLDGGAMFGIVPRVLWERKCPPDEKNRIRQNANCLFVDTGSEKILIETGMGEKWSAKHESIYGIERERPFAESLREIAGCSPDEIDIVVNTHLHFDHAGGNTVFDEGGRAVPQFPNARYFVSASELDRAENPIERDRASYLPENWRPLAEEVLLEVKPDDYEVAPGIWMTTVRGHSATMQTVRLDSGGKTLYGFADLIPTTSHLPLPWIMGYDLYPVETLESKRRLLAQALDENWLCLFYHDPDTPLCTLRQGEKEIEAVPFMG
jgi:glyoxylase-like metal-dependent hydrolase (beta-lactamase superfamily II)